MPTETKTITTKEIEMTLHIVTPPIGESPTPDAYRAACDALAAKTCELADLRERFAALAGNRAERRKAKKLGIKPEAQQ